MFQSTLPVWGATSGAGCLRIGGECFNPRSPCGERLEMLRATHAAMQVSIHAPRVGSDGREHIGVRLIRVSIHAPRVGSDPGE